MADVKISELNGATTPLSGTEVVPLVQNGETKKVAVSEIGGGANPTSGFYPINYNGNLVNSGLQNTSDSLPGGFEYFGLKFIEDSFLGTQPILFLQGMNESYSLGNADSENGGATAGIEINGNMGAVTIGCGVSSPSAGVFKVSGDAGFIRLGNSDTTSIGVNMFQNGFRVGSNLIYDQGGNKRIRVFDEVGTEYYINLHTI